MVRFKPEATTLMIIINLFDDYFITSVLCFSMNKKRQKLSGVQYFLNRFINSTSHLIVHDM